MFLAQNIIIILGLGGGGSVTLELDSDECDDLCTLCGWESQVAIIAYHMSPLLHNMLCDHGAGKVEGVRINDPQPKSYTLPHPIWSQEELEGVKITHDPPKDKTETVREGIKGGGERGRERERREREREREGEREGEREREREGG